MKSNDLLNEYQVDSARRPGFFALLLILMIFYLVCLAFAEFVRQGSLSNISLAEWGLMAIVFMIPLLGIVLFLLKKKAGWIILTFYFILITSILILGFSYLYIKKNTESIWWTHLVLLPLIAIIVLLLHKKTIQFFKIKKASLIITIGLAIALSSLMLLDF